jgi:hypothetical protein
MHISIAAIACAWFYRNVFQLCDAGFKGRTMYFETVDWATWKPSIRSSPWIRDAPHNEFSLLIAGSDRAGRDQSLPALPYFGISNARTF